MPFLNQSDEQLIAEYISSDNEEIFVFLLNKYTKPVYNFIRYINNNNTNEAEDITQEVFIKVWKNLKRFDASKNFKVWIFTIAKNTALDWLKKRNTLPLSLLSEDIADSEQVSIIDKIYQKSLSKNLTLAIEKLPSKYSSIINLYHQDDLNFREISGLLNESINTVKSRYRRGLIILKNML